MDRRFELARKIAGLGLFGLVVVMVLLDACRTDFSTDPLVLVPILVTGSSLFAVELPIKPLGGISHNPAVMPSRESKSK